MSWLFQNLNNQIPSPVEALGRESLVHHLIHLQVHIREPHVSVNAFLVLLVQCRDGQNSHNTCEHEAEKQGVLNISHSNAETLCK